MSNRGDRADRLSERLDRHDDSSSPAPKEGTGESVKDRPSVLMYIPEDLREDLDLTFDELKLELRKENGEEIKKNEDYYPAVIRSGLNDKQDLKTLLEP